MFKIIIQTTLIKFWIIELREILALIFLTYFS